MGVEWTLDIGVPGVDRPVDGDGEDKVLGLDALSPHSYVVLSGGAPSSPSPPPPPSPPRLSHFLSTSATGWTGGSPAAI